MRRIEVDVLIIGGGPAGLWSLDALRRAGYTALLLENKALGTGQTVGSQGIIHGGLKYTLDGVLSASAKAIREMPGVWRKALAGGGDGQPDLSATTMRSDFCFLWRTSDWRSRLGMVGARAGLRVKPTHLDREQWPEVLAQLKGDVFRLDEQVVSPPSLVQALADLHRESLLKIDDEAFGVEADGVGRVTAVRVNEGLSFVPSVVVLTAGVGNATLRELSGLREERMQRRPVHMILARGASLPPINGHCVDGAKTRVTLSTDRDSAGRVVWQVGGQVSEDGVDIAPEALIVHAQEEVSAAMGGLRFTPDVEWSTYKLDKAEVVTSGGRRPDDAYVERTGNVVTAWPTKLALVPRLAERVVEVVDGPPTVGGMREVEALTAVDRPDVAAPPWEEPRTWTRTMRSISTAARSAERA